MPTTYELAQPRPQSAAPVLDPSQQAVVDHRGGPLLVLAGPGTGKTTTLVEAVVDRIENRGLKPSEVLVLTFSRKAADELRTRIGGRLARTTETVPAMTFHAFCYALVRDCSDDEVYSEPLTLLSAAEQDWRIQEVINGSLADNSIGWPASLRPALRTRGLARELQTLMARVRALGLEPEDLADIARTHSRPAWHAAAEVFEEYLTSLDSQGQTDYSEVVYRALLLANHPEFGPMIRSRYKLVVVDEYQDTDRLQVALLKAIAGAGRDLIAVGDPDQSIYAFRGAEMRGIYDFGEDFSFDGQHARAVALTATRRFGPVLLAASRSILAQTGRFGGIDGEVFDRFRNPESVHAQFATGCVTVCTYATPSAEAEHIALALREAHLRDEVPWQDMAVLVRSGVASLPRLERALIAAGVPVEVANDDMPMVAEPAVRALLSALRAADERARGRPIDPEAAQELLTGPLCGLDASAIRRLARALRKDHRLDGSLQRSDLLLAESLGEPEMLRIDAAHHGEPAAEAGRKAHALAALIGTAAGQVDAHVPTEEALWTLWDGTDWPGRLRRTAEAGMDGSLGAHRDLDAIRALFEAAARAEVRKKHVGVGSFIDELNAQEIPGQSLSGRRMRGDAVQLMTAHGSKGLEWRRVVVAGVQEGLWPDLRYRGTLLQADRLARDGVADRPPPSALLAEERRLFYVAATRARERLLVTAVESPREDGDQPSRFLTGLREFTAATTEHTGVQTHSAQSPGVERDAVSLRRPQHALSLRSAVARLRRFAEAGSSAQVRGRAANQLAVVAAQPFGAPANPARWWGMRDFTVNAVPVRPVGKPLALSGSALDGLVSCPLKWFLSREVKGEEGTGTAQGFGLLIHRLAAEVVHHDTVDPSTLEGHLDRVWDELDYAAPWIAQRDRVEAHLALARFARWHNQRAHNLRDDRRPLAAEWSFECEIPVGSDTVILRGSMDRVEVDAGGGIHVVDFKTSRSAVSGGDLATHPQLGVYQVAVGHGGLGDLADRLDLADDLDLSDVEGPQSAGAELVQLRVAENSANPDFPKVQPQDPPQPGEPFFAYQQLADAAHTVRAESFDATPGDVCTFCSFRSLCPAQPEGKTILADEDR